MNDKILHSVSWILLIVGGLNWGLEGLGDLIGSNLNVIRLVLGGWPQLESIVYVLVGLSAIYELTVHKKNCKKCEAGGSM